MAWSVNSPKMQGHFRPSALTSYKMQGTTLLLTSHHSSSSPLLDSPLRSLTPLLARAGRAQHASMTRVHPNVASAAAPAAPAAPALAAAEAGAVSLTVWRRSLLFNGKGFTVFDGAGNLVFRVETYAGGSRREVVLMDADGRALLTIRRKKLSLADEWLVYDGDAASPSPSAPAPKRFTARRHVSLRQTKSLAHLSPARASAGGVAAPSCGYDVEGSYAGRCLDVFASPSAASAGEQQRRRRVAAVCRKEAAVGPDVFRLVVEPGFEPALAMAVVILLDQMHAP
ncbi:hypothetical protein GUJ93_ZPchr0010g7215 [Zizania palustris]|uniref:Protein LURP-one-related 8 n=1 Tax=Zizania palustris TaxID=103762 RepID=A0A8J6BDC7_ZIZPA|nr:hypothetical protein GUJ93_ZPchr0010g7215 [Zizania palustris]